jgi:hypothetical protein
LTTALTSSPTLLPLPLPSIRWKDHVEEIKFIGHPNEHEKWIRNRAKYEKKEQQQHQQQSCSTTSTPTIPEEELELESRLVSMNDDDDDDDGNEDRIFVKDFWDTFEDSLDVVLNTVVGGCGCK